MGAADQVGGAIVRGAGALAGAAERSEVGAAGNAGLRAVEGAAVSTGGRAVTGAGARTVVQDVESYGVAAAPRAPAAPQPAPTAPGGALAPAAGAAVRTGAATAAADAPTAVLAAAEREVAAAVARNAPAAELSTLRATADSARGRIIQGMERELDTLRRANGPAAQIAALEGQRNAAVLAQLRERSTNLFGNAATRPADALKAHADFAREAERQGDAMIAAGNRTGGEALLVQAGRAWDRAGTSYGTGAATIMVSENAAAQAVFTRLGNAQGVFQAAARTAQYGNVIEGTFRSGRPALAREVTDLARQANRLPKLTDSEFGALQRAFNDMQHGDSLVPLATNGRFLHPMSGN